MAVDNNFANMKMDKNPWEEVFKGEPDDILKRIRAGEDFMYSGDRCIIEKRNKELIDKGKRDNVFVTSLLPKPYRGNLKDPKLVILSLNPGYKKRVKKTLFTLLRHDCQKRFVEITKENALLKAHNIISLKDDVDDVMDNGYWSGQLSELEKDGANLSKIGLIQLIPYASEHFDSWEDDTNLPSQKFSTDIIRRLLQKDESTLFIVMRSEKKWEKLIGKYIGKTTMKDNEGRFIINKHPICQKLSPNNLGEVQYNRIVEILKK